MVSDDISPEDAGTLGFETINSAPPFGSVGAMCNLWESFTTLVFSQRRVSAKSEGSLSKLTGLIFPSAIADLLIPFSKAATCELTDLQLGKANSWSIHWSDNTWCFSV